MFLFLKKFISLFMPQPLKRFYLKLVFGYSIADSASVGFSWVFPKVMSLGEFSRINSFNIFKSLDSVVLGRNASIGSLNFFTAFPDSDQHFVGMPRCRALYIGDESAITNQHLIDCTNSITVGSFSTVAGYRSQLLTHSIDPNISRQCCAPIVIGNYCFIGTSSTLLMGSFIPDCSIIGANSLVTGPLDHSWSLYAGVPVKLIKNLDKNCLYFQRDSGRVF